MNIRNVSIKDYEKIKILFKRHNMNMIDFKRWVNLWKKNPSLKNNKIKWIKGWVIEKNNKIVGHIGHFPMQYFLNKKPYLCSVLYTSSFGGKDQASTREYNIIESMSFDSAVTGKVYPIKDYNFFSLPRIYVGKKTYEKTLMNHLSVFYNLASKLFN